MAYLTCPRCGTTYFDRNPLAAPHTCPRCAATGKSIDLQPVKRRGAAASLLRPARESDSRKTRKAG